MTPDTITIDGFGPLPVARPTSAAELGDLVRRCAAEGRAVYPVGGGTMLDYGLPPSKPGLALDTRALNQVIDYPARDMTITVQAGITIARLREVTRAEGLDLPIDVPEPERATLGGAIACNVSGPRRYGYGTFRDYVLGITTVNDRGEAVSAGGRVVKNVAGYDLMKLHTGALGTLGVITQVTLKLRPVPEDEGRIEFECQNIDELAKTIEALNGTKTRPVVLDFFQTWGEDYSKRRWTVYVRFDGSKDAVDWQMQQIEREVTAVGVDPAGIETARSPHATLRPSRHPIYTFVYRAGMRPSGLIDFCRKAEAHRGSLSCFASGIARSCFIAADEPGDVAIVSLSEAMEMLQALVSLSEAKAMLQELTEVAGRYDGNIVVERCPPEWKKSLPVWGLPPADLALQKAVKRALDPNNLFNPGRFVTDV